MGSPPYDLWKLRAKGLVEKIPHSRGYRIPREGYAICLVFLKLFERIYAPLTAGLLLPLSGDRKPQPEKRTQLDKLYQRVVDIWAPRKCKGSRKKTWGPTRFHVGPFVGPSFWPVLKNMLLSIPERS